MARGRRGSGMDNRGNRTPYINPNPSNNQRGSGAKNRGREGGNFSGDQQKNKRGEWARENRNPAADKPEEKKQKTPSPSRNRTNIKQQII